MWEEFLSEPSRLWKAGYDAYMHGADRGSCSLLENDIRRKYWYAGYDAAYVESFMQ